MKAIWAALKGEDGPVVHEKISKRYGDRSGWTVAPGVSLPGYLLLSHFDGSLARHRVDLVDLSTFETLYSWFTEADEVFAGLDPDDAFSKRMKIEDNWRYRMIHPLPMRDGGLIFKDHGSPLVRIDACGNVLWSETSARYHHSVEMSGTDAVWTGSGSPPRKLRPELKVDDGFQDDAPAEVSLDGKVLRVISLTDLLIHAGMESEFLTDLLGGTLKDPIHLNDIQPVREDGPYWRKGDLFLSFRHMSTVLLYRPSTNEVLWWRRGPWLAQHDVDVIDDHRISVFSNNTYDAGKGPFVQGHNQVMVYDFDTDSVSMPFDEAMERLDVKTVTEGLADWLPNGAIFIEEDNNGRAMFISPDNQLLAEYVNRGGGWPGLHHGMEPVHRSGSRGCVAIDSRRCSLRRRVTRFGRRLPARIGSGSRDRLDTGTRPAAPPALRGGEPVGQAWGCQI